MQQWVSSGKHHTAHQTTHWDLQPKLVSQFLEKLQRVCLSSYVARLVVQGEPW